MRNIFISIDASDLVLVRSDAGDGGWSLHAPGATDAAIADGSAPYLASGEAPGPTAQDRARAAREYAQRAAPWSAMLVEVEGGFHAFESVSWTVDADEQWRIMRNGRVWAHRTTLGEARALVRNTAREAGPGSVWAIVGRDGAAESLEG